MARLNISWVGSMGQNGAVHVSLSALAECERISVLNWSCWRWVRDAWDAITRVEQWENWEGYGAQLVFTPRRFSYVQSEVPHQVVRHTKQTQSVESRSEQFEIIKIVENRVWCPIAQWWIPPSILQSFLNAEVKQPVMFKPRRPSTSISPDLSPKSILLWLVGSVPRGAQRSSLVSNWHFKFQAFHF